MHDEQLERRVRAALATEAARLPLTITSAELERRLSFRGRGAGNRRVTLLLAAAVAVGVLGAGSLLGGAIQVRPTATDPMTAAESRAPMAPAASPAGPVTLPTLAEFIAADAGNGEVLVAQSHDPFVAQAKLLQQPGGGASAITFPVMYATGQFNLAIVCLGDQKMEYDIMTSPGTSPGRTLDCDGTLTIETIAVDGPARLVLSFREPVQWRVVVTGQPGTLPLPTDSPILQFGDVGQEELVHMDDQTMDSSDQWGDTGLVLRETAALPGRFEYSARLWCQPGEHLRLIFGDHLENAPELTPETETVVRCNGLAMDVDLRIVQPNGSRVFVAAAPGTRWSLLISSDTPPVALADDDPGWQLSSGFGPEYNFEEHGVSLSNGGVEGGGPLLVRLECAGPSQRIKVNFDGREPLGDTGAEFFADCAPGGVRTGQLLTTKGDGYLVDFVAPAGTWTALTVLVPDPLPTTR